MENKTESPRRTIIYVNFAPYENAGRILDYIFSRYSTVIVFCFNFHKLTRKRQPSIMTIYEKRKVVSKHRLYYLPTPQAVAFLLLPIRSLIILLQLLIHGYSIKKQYGTVDTYFTVNAFTAWCGNVLKKFGFVRSTTFWVWDYYPPVHKSIIVTVMRWLYWQYDKPATLLSDKVVFLNKRLEHLRKDIGLLPEDAQYPVVGIGTTPTDQPKKGKTRALRVVFLGVVKKSQGLDLLYDSSKDLIEKYPEISLDIIGSGPDEEYFKERAQQTGIPSVFHGYVTDENEVDTIIRSCTIGIATYAPEEGNVSYYSDPSKIKRYLSQAVPAITTDVFDFSQEISSDNAGIVIPFEKKALISAIAKIRQNYEVFSKNALTLARKYYYKNLYRKLLD